MADIAMQHKGFVFGEFMLDETRAALFRGGEEVRLRRQSFEVLRYLVRNANRLVTKEELFAAVWPGSVVTDDSLTQCLVEIRRAIGDDRHEIIRTVPRRGYVLDIPVEVVGGDETTDPAAAEAPTRARSRLQWPIIGAVALFGVAALWWSTQQTAGQAGVAATASAPAAAGVSIAVLPFVDMSDGQDQQYFADGLSEEILNLLAQQPELRVIARTSSFAFRDRQDADIAEIATRLDVTHVLEGSVRKSGSRVRITAQLVAAADSSHLWSHAYDRELDDLLAVQGEIAGQITRAMKLRLVQADRPVARPAAVHPEAYEHYLHARFLHNRRAPGDLLAAEDHYLRAVGIDERFGRAWAGLAGTLLVRIFESEGDQDPQHLLERMRDAVERAVALEPGSAEVQVRTAQYHFHSGNLERSEEHHRKAKAADPDHPLVLGAGVGFALARGDHDEAVARAERAVDRDPLAFVARRNLANDLAVAGRYEDAHRELMRARELNPERGATALDEAQNLYLLGRPAEALEILRGQPDGARREAELAIVYHALGMEHEAEAEIAKLRSRDDSEHALHLAEVHAQRDELDEAFAWLQAARDAKARSAPTPGSRRYPVVGTDSALLRPLHGDPRWQQFLRPNDL